MNIEMDSRHLATARAPVNALERSVSWGAVFAGAAGAAAVTLLLLALGTGLGLSSVSPWSSEGVSATTFGVSTIVWITLTQLLASGLGGYLAGRLRANWDDLHADEVYFRNTAHGFLAWAVASLLMAALLGSVASAIVGGGVKAASTVASGVASGAATATNAAAGIAKSDDGSMDYFVHSLFRSQPGAAPAATTDGTPAAAAPAAPAANASSESPAEMASEASQVLVRSVQTGTLSPDDTRYVGQLVSQKTGLSQPEAEKKVSDLYAQLQTTARDAETKAREAADQARKASAYGALWIFISLLIGAFVASLSALLGAKHRIEL